MTLAGIGWIALRVLVALGALVALLSPLAILRPLRRLVARKESLAQAQLLLDLDQLSERSAELERIPARIAPLIERLTRVRRSLEVSIRMLRLPQAMAALRAAGLAMRTLARVFHSG